MTARMAALASCLLLACGGGTGSARAPEPPAGPDLSPALAPASWMLGDWQHDGGSEHWVATAGTFYGVGFGEGGFYELMIIDDAPTGAAGTPDGTLRLYAMPGGRAPVVFTGRDGDGGLVFENPAHDDPTSITYAPAAGGLTATVRGPRTDLTLAMQAIDGAPAPAAEEADLAFARDTDVERARGWTRWFADDGAWIRGETRLDGKAAIGDAIAPLLSRADLLWTPVWSRLSPDGTLAATVGRARTIENAAVTWRGSYLTVWRREPAGWRVLVDVGRDENAL